jgi:tRNA(adenine34) deaminase
MAIRIRVFVGDVLSTGRNLGRTTNDPTAHGEMVAIRRIAAVRPAADLQGTTLYTSGQPRPMCMSAILWRGIRRFSIDELAMRRGQIVPTSRQVADAAPFTAIAITGGFCPPRRWRCFPSDPATSDPAR